MTQDALGLDRLDFAKGAGLITVVTQHAVTGAVLMVAHMGREALDRTVATGEMYYHSRGRGLWRKGDTSGNAQRWLTLSVDCDGDALLARVMPAGPACHTGAVTCFEGAPGDALTQLAATIAQRASASNGYTSTLLNDRNLRLKKIAEEAGEFAIACADGERVAEEAADLIYHALVAMHAAGVTLDDVRAVLHERSRP
jgi:phosphoribosyl-ATP pyrophosphohydrolase/phosphoribosyl-AMP cyclohydrolase